VLRSALTKAVATVAQTQGADPAAWRKPVHCPGQSPPGCDENRPITAGAIATPAHPFENRGTFHQAVEVLRDLDPVTRRPVAGGHPQGGGGLAATGGAPLAATIGLLLLLATVGARRLTRG
jgi:hypothetical protein